MRKLLMLFLLLPVGALADGPPPPPIVERNTVTPPARIEDLPPVAGRQMPVPPPDYSNCMARCQQYRGAARPRLYVEPRREYMENSGAIPLYYVPPTVFVPVVPLYDEYYAAVRRERRMAWAERRALHYSNPGAVAVPTPDGGYILYDRNTYR